MPNHCESDLWVSGDREKLEEFREFARGPGSVPSENLSRAEEAPLSAHKFIPMPKLFRETRLRCVGCGRFNNSYKCSNCGGTASNGYNRGGYNWCVANWGTKWGMYEVELLDDLDFLKDELFYSFRSAWAPPAPVIIAMAERFPELRFRMLSYEMGAAYQSALVLESGEVVEEWTADYSGDRGG